MKPNPFHVLGLPVSADVEAIVERGQQLAVTGAADAGTLAEWAMEELTGRDDETRELHELLEAPGTDYRNDRWTTFAKRHGGSLLVTPETLARLREETGPPRASDFDMAAIIRLLLEDLLTPPVADVGPALANAPVPLRLDSQPLEVRDVLFG